MKAVQKSAHFLGIGGIGISGLALWYKNLGWRVTGSDIAESPVIDMLRRFGVDPEIGDEQFVNIPDGVNLIIHTQAIDRNRIVNPETRRPDSPAVLVKSYPEALGELSKNKFTIAVCGSHGKSTTTAMAGLFMIDAGLNPTVLVGTMLREFSNSNFRFGSSKYLVIEADEFRGAFLNYFPDIVIWTNVVKEHLDYFKDLADAIGHFRTFIKHVPKDGFIIANRDDRNIRQVLRGAENAVFYSLRDLEADYIRKRIKIPGEHNISNSLAIIKLARLLHMPDETAYDSISNYHGSWRRFEYKGKINGAEVYDDYAHHPTEIKATLRGARDKFKKKKIWAVFQPHQFERTKLLFKEFAGAFKDVDKVIMLDIYGVKGREGKSIKEEISSEKLIKAIAKTGKEAIYKSNFSEAAEFINKNAGAKDVVIIMGAGSVWQIFKFLKVQL